MCRLLHRNKWQATCPVQFAVLDRHDIVTAKESSQVQQPDTYSYVQTQSWACKRTQCRYPFEPAPNFVWDSKAPWMQTCTLSKKIWVMDPQQKYGKKYLPFFWVEGSRTNHEYAQANFKKFAFSYVFTCVRNFFLQKQKKMPIVARWLPATQLVVPLKQKDNLKKYNTDKGNTVFQVRNRKNDSDSKIHCLQSDCI